MDYPFDENLAITLGELVPEFRVIDPNPGSGRPAKTGRS